jgi:nucleoside-diphosphate-sugar epimerase
MKILVTGGGGFLGRHIVALLVKRDYTVSTFSRAPKPELRELGVTHMEGDLSDAAAVGRACAGMDAVFHTAARAGVWGSWLDFFEPNVLGTRHVLAACRQVGVPILVYTSTPSVVFNGEPFTGADESLPYGRNWLCHYAHTKSIAEREVLAANDGAAFRSIALRPHLIWGVGDPHIIPRVIAKARSGRLRIIGDGRNRVDITHVRDAAAAHLCALDALTKGNPGGKPYFISQGEPVVLWDWINQLLQSVGVPPIGKRISLRAAYRVGAVLEGIYKLFRISAEPPMTRFVAVELAKDHFFNTAAARKDLGYEPRTTSEEGIKELATDLTGTSAQA